MKIKYIIDYKGYGNIYQMTNTRNGECLDITKEEAKDYFDESTTYFSAKAEVSVRSVEFEVTSTESRWYDPSGRIRKGTVI